MFMTSTMLCNVSTSSSQYRTLALLGKEKGKEKENKTGYPSFFFLGTMRYLAYFSLLPIPSHTRSRLASQVVYERNSGSGGAIHLILRMFIVYFYFPLPRLLSFY
jgi:hypothetical protein